MAFIDCIKLITNHAYAGFSVVPRADLYRESLTEEAHFRCREEDAVWSPSYHESDLGGSETEMEAGPAVEVDFADAAGSMPAPTSQPCGPAPPCSLALPRACEQRRRSSQLRVAHRWGLSVEDAAEIMANVAEAQSHS